MQIHSFVATYRLDQSHDSFLKIFVFFDKCSIDSLFLPTVTSAYIHNCFNIRMSHNSLYNFYIPSWLLQVYIDSRRSNGDHMSLILSSQFQKIIRGLRTCYRMKPLKNRILLFPYALVPVRSIDIYSVDYLFERLPCRMNQYASPLQMLHRYWSILYHFALLFPTAFRDY